MTTTETVSSRFATLEDWPSTDLVEAIVEGQLAAVAAVRAAGPALARAIDAASERLARGGRLVYMGAGTSGRIAAQDCAELPPTFAWPSSRSLVFMAGGPTALTEAAEGAEDNEAEARDALDAAGIGLDDVVIGVAASGNTPFTLAGLDRAGVAGALTIGVYNNGQGRMAAHCVIPVLADTGAEIVAGSTRMKAGTAQKVVLNTLSTGIMIRLGYVYRGRMVEMRPTNIKLEQRAVAMVADLSGATPDKAAEALALAGGSIKLATLVLAKNLDIGPARAALDAAGGLLRDALRS